MKGRIVVGMQTGNKDPAKMSKVLDFLADNENEPDSTGATLEAGPLPE